MIIEEKHREIKYKIKAIYTMIIIIILLVLITSLREINVIINNTKKETLH
jgi:hypothetical protein